MPFHDQVLRSLLAGLTAGLMLVALARHVPVLPPRGEPPAAPRAPEGDPPALRGFA
ncbi:MAG: hypothetical protein MUC64_05595 [Rubritepida sp.]|jgi:hypothetical protein|nr:hypothetical protein [Rubritepida sp.]